MKARVSRIYFVHDCRFSRAFLNSKAVYGVISIDRIVLTMSATD